MILYDEGNWHFAFLFRVEGSVVPKVLCYAVPSSLLAVLLACGEEMPGGVRNDSFRKFISLGQTQIWTVVSMIIMILLAFRITQALGRFWEATGLLHQMRGEWFDAISCLMSFSRQAMWAKPIEVREFRHTLLRLASLLHACSLHEIKDIANEHFRVVDLHGLDDTTLDHLRMCCGGSGTWWRCCCT